MKTAQAFADQVLAAGIGRARGKAILGVFNEMMRELRQMLESGAVGSNAELAAIFNKCDQTWREFAKLVPAVNLNGFQELLRKDKPEVYGVWQKACYEAHMETLRARAGSRGKRR